MPPLQGLMALLNGFYKHIEGNTQANKPAGTQEGKTECPKSLGRIIVQDRGSWKRYQLPLALLANCH